MNDDNPLSGNGRLVVGALCAAAGIVPILAGFDIGPLRQSDIHGPAVAGRGCRRHLRVTKVSSKE